MGNMPPPPGSGNPTPAQNLAQMQQMNAEVDRLAQLIQTKFAQIKTIYREQVRQFNDNMEYLGDARQVMSEFDTQVDRLTELFKGSEKAFKLSHEQANKLVAIMRARNITVEELQELLVSAGANLSKDLQDIRTVLGNVSSEYLDSLNVITHGTAKTAEGIRKAGEAFVNLLNGTEEEVNKLVTTVEDIKRLGSRIDLFKSRPDKEMRDISAIMENDLKNFKRFAINAGMDSQSVTEIETMFAAKKAQVENLTSQIVNEAANMDETNEKEIMKKIEKNQKEAAAIAVSIRKEYNKASELYQQRQNVLEMGAGGLGNMADGMQSVSNSIRNATSSLKNMNFMDAIRSFQQAHKIGKTVAAGAGQRAAAEWAGDGNAFKRGGMSGVFRLVQGIAKASTAFLAIVQIIMLLNDARNKAIEFNKTLLESQGLVGLGFDIQTPTSHGEMDNKLHEIRESIKGRVGEALEYGITQEEGTKVIAELGRQGVMVKELQEKGANLFDTVKSVTALSRAFMLDNTGMARLMGSVSTNLNLSMKEVEARFTDIATRWEGTRISFESYSGTVQSLGEEQSIFSSRLTSVAKFLEAAGKNALLSSKDAIEGVQASVSYVDNLTPAFRRQVVARYGIGNMAETLRKRAAVIEKQIEDMKAAGIEPAEGLRESLRKMNVYIQEIADGKGGDIDPQRIWAFGDLGLNLHMLWQNVMDTHKDLGTDVENMRMADLDSATNMGQKISRYLGLDNDEYDKQLKAVFSMAGKGQDATFKEMVNSLLDVNEGISDQGDNINKLAELSRQSSKNLMTSGDALKIAQEAFFNKLYYMVKMIHSVIERIAGVFGKGSGKAAKAQEAFDSALTRYGDSSLSSKVGSKEYYDNLTNILDSFSRMKRDGATPEQMQEAASRLPTEVRQSIQNLSQGKTATGKDDDYLANRPEDLERISKEVMQAIQNTHELSKAVRVSLTSGNDQLVDTPGRSFGSRAQSYAHGISVANALGQGRKDAIVNYEEWKGGKRSKGLSVIPEKEGRVYNIRSPIDGVISSIEGNHVIIDTSAGRKVELFPITDSVVNWGNLATGTKVSAGNLLGTLGGLTTNPQIHYKALSKEGELMPVQSLIDADTVADAFSRPATAPPKKEDFEEGRLDGSGEGLVGASIEFPTNTATETFEVNLGGTSLEKNSYTTLDDVIREIASRPNPSLERVETIVNERIDYTLNTDPRGIALGVLAMLNRKDTTSLVREGVAKA